MQVCKKCVLPETYPGIKFDSAGICNYCNNSIFREKDEVNDHFLSEEELKKCLEKYKKLPGKYDVLVSVSGGVDSCFALIKIVADFGLTPLVFYNDHGFEDETAEKNVRNLCKVQDLDLVIWQHDLGFMKKLWKYFNESDIKGMSACYICGNVLYFNALELADRFNIALVVNGYSKGQVAMMHDQEKGRVWLDKMIKELLRLGDMKFLAEFTDKYRLLSKQKMFRTKQDLEAEVEPEKILIIPFYIFKFYKTNKEALKKVCLQTFDWKPLQTSYPARTTNCEMIWLNTYIDLKKRKYSLYHEEYSSLIRAGEISREQAFADLEFTPPEGLLERLAGEIGMRLDPKEKESCAAADSFADEEKKNISEKYEASFDF